MLFRRNNRRGANALEFALTLPAFIAITFGMMEFGYFFSRRALVNSVIGRSCRDAALIDSERPGPSAPGCGTGGDDCVIEVAEKFMTDLSADAGLSCTNCTATVEGSTPARVVACSMDVDYADITGLFSGFFPSTLQARTEVILEWQRDPS